MRRSVRTGVGGGASCCTARRARSSAAAVPPAAPSDAGASTVRAAGVRPARTAGLRSASSGGVMPRPAPSEYAPAANRSGSPAAQASPGGAPPPTWVPGLPGWTGRPAYPAGTAALSMGMPYGAWGQGDAGWGCAHADPHPPGLRPAISYSGAGQELAP